ncbi:MAG TPA: hypothetical protein VE076_09215 [Nitrososphaeraceae archaeon]|nr:hypothetical protein [Nitrososphaeraceae archaeon]
MHLPRIVVMVVVVAKLAQLTIWGQNVLQIMTIRTTPLSIDNNISTMFAFLRHKRGMFAIKIERYIAN